MSTDHLGLNTPSPGGSDRAAPTRPSSGDLPLRRPRDGRRSSRSRSTAPGTADGPNAPVTGTPPSNLTGPIRHLLGPMTANLRPGVTRSGGASDQRLRVDWPRCKAHGLCAEIAPEIIRLDEWGYPVFAPGAVATGDLATARKAVQVCPNLALRLVEIPPEG